VFFKRVWWLWLVTLVMMLAVFGLIGAIALVKPALAGLPVLIAFIWAPFGYAIYKACEWRWWVSGVRFGDVRFESKLTAGALAGLYGKVIGWSVLLLIALSIWGGGVGALAALVIAPKSSSSQAIVTIMQNPVVLIVLAIGYIACALAFGVVVRMYLRRDVWARVVVSSVVYNLAAADNVAARGEAANALGEGFADNFDIGGF
jgi:uncharacterized membrane protein YjgN (DUF898 family)